MRPIYILAGLVCLGVLVFVSCGHQEEGKYAIVTGRVTDTDTSIYLPGVKVFEKSHAKLSTVTDSLGFFELRGVMFEEHNIYFEKDGYEPYTLWFEYTGKLARPAVTHKIIMKKVGS